MLGRAGAIVSGAGGRDGRAWPCTACRSVHQHIAHGRITKRFWDERHLSTRRTEAWRWGVGEETACSMRELPLDGLPTDAGGSIRLVEDMFDTAGEVPSSARRIER